MLKAYWALIVLVVLWVVVFGVLGPALISARDDLLVLAGVALVVLFPVSLVGWWKIFKPKSK